MIKTAKAPKRNFQAYQTKVMDICFDEKSIEKFSGGLKMIVASGEPPLFVKVDRLKNKNANYSRSLAG